MNPRGNRLSLAVRRSINHPHSLCQIVNVLQLFHHAGMVAISARMCAHVKPMCMHDVRLGNRTPHEYKVPNDNLITINDAVLLCATADEKRIASKFAVGYRGRFAFHRRFFSSSLMKTV